VATTPPDATPVGELIAYHRRRRGLSQVKLAGLLGRSESWLSQVERGTRSIDRISVLLEVARALEVAPTDLAPGSFLLDDAQPEHPTVRTLRMALTGHETLAGLFGDRQDDALEPPDLDHLREQLDRAWELVHGSRYEDLSESLPALLVVMEAAPRRLEGSDSAAAFALLAELHQATAGLLAKLGATDLAWLAAERAYLAAERSGDPLLAGISDFRLTHVFLSAGRSAQAQRVATVAARALETSAGPDSPPQLLSVWGALNLVAAVIASTQGDRDLALEHLGKAETAAGWIGQDRNDYHTEFGPTNVALHSVAVSVELGDAGDALRKAADIDTSLLSQERRARFLIDIARAHAQRRRAPEAVRALKEAETYAPEQVRSHHHVRDMVRDLLRGERRAVNPELRKLAQRIGVLP
jgi:transcriptional regulator with XRE-family HTH domain